MIVQDLNIIEIGLLINAIKGSSSTGNDPANPNIQRVVRACWHIHELKEELKKYSNWQAPAAQ